jgi:hypothetical protein
MRIHESMAHSGSSSIVREGDVPPVLLRPDSPTLIIEEQVLTDMEEDDSTVDPTGIRRRLGPGTLQLTRQQQQLPGYLSAPSNPEDGLTDTEVMSEEEDPSPQQQQNPDVPHSP